jgi:hypothetical protein
MFMAGWVLVFASTIPITIGIIAAQQGAYAPLVLGITMLVTAIALIIIGSMKRAASPDRTRPLPGPETISGRQAP